MPHRRSYCFKLRVSFPLSSAVCNLHYYSKVAAGAGTWGDAGAAGAPPQRSRQRTSTHEFHSKFQVNIHLYIKLPITTLCAGTRPGGDAGAAGAPPQRPGRDSGRAACPQWCAATAAPIGRLSFVLSSWVEKHSLTAVRTSTYTASRPRHLNRTVLTHSAMLTKDEVAKLVEERSTIPALAKGSLKHSVLSICFLCTRRAGE